MRVISQDGTIDVPYEMSAIRNDDGLIILCMAGETGKGSVIARYSTSEKAEKAMKMLRKEYCEHYFGKGGAMSTANFYVQPFGFIPPKIFQFPQDEDVEVYRMKTPIIEQKLNRQLERIEKCTNS